MIRIRLNLGAVSVRLPVEENKVQMDHGKGI